MIKPFWEGTKLYQIDVDSIKKLSCFNMNLNNDLNGKMVFPIVSKICRIWLNGSWASMSGMLCVAKGPFK